MPDQVPKAVVQERYERLRRAAGRDRLGGEQGARSAGCSRCWSPRARAARTARPTGCPVAPPTTGSCTSPCRPAVEPPRPGDVVTVEVTYAAPHHLVADGAFGGVRRTRAGDAWEARQGGTPVPAGVLLGMPTVGAPRRSPGRRAPPAADVLVARGGLPAPAAARARASAPARPASSTGCGRPATRPCAPAGRRADRWSSWSAAPRGRPVRRRRLGVPGRLRRRGCRSAIRPGRAAPCRCR